MSLGDVTPALRLVVAMFVGALLGIERAVSTQRGGMCTHALVSTGSCLFHLLQPDTTVMASAVLASATMIKADEQVRGINTAVSVWIAAGTGAACAIEEFGVALSAAGVALFAQLLNRAIVFHLEKKREVDALGTS